MLCHGFRSQAGRRRLRRGGALVALAVVGGCAAEALASGVVPGPAALEPACMSTFEAGIHPVSWRRTAQGGETARLDAWCTGVGPAVIAGPSDGDRDGASALDSLVVVTWNVHVGGGDIVRLVGDLRRGALTGGRPVESFVLLLQEAHRAGTAVPAEATPGSYPVRIFERPPTGDRIDVLQAAHLLGLHLLYVPSMRNGVGAGPAEDRGNAILSTLPLADAEAIELPYEAQRRVAVGATVHAVAADGTPWRLRVVSAHLDNRSAGERLLGSFGSGRARQARALADAIVDPAAVIGADLNSWSASFLESAIPLLRASFPETPANAMHTYPVARGLWGRTLDHLLVRVPDGWRASVRRVDDRYGSDHYPLIGMVRRQG